MKIRLTKDLEQFVHDAVRAGLYAGEDDVVHDALTRLQKCLPSAAPGPAREAESTRQAEPRKLPVSPEELNRRLLASGLILQLPDPALDIDDDNDPPVEIQGEPLSETIIRERR